MDESGVLVPLPATELTEGGDGWELLGTGDDDDWANATGA